MSFVLYNSVEAQDLLGSVVDINLLSEEDEFVEKKEFLLQHENNDGNQVLIHIFIFGNHPIILTLLS
jgi:hypothetical protein